MTPLPPLGAFFQPTCLCSPFLACSLPASAVCSVLEVRHGFPAWSPLSRSSLPLPPRGLNSQISHLVCLCSSGQAGPFLPRMGTWGLCRVFFLPVWYPCDEAIHSSLLWLQAPLSALWSCAAALHGGGARHWFLVLGVEPGFAGSQLGEAQTWTLRGRDSGSMRERPGQKPSGGGDGLEVNWGATEKASAEKAWQGMLLLHSVHTRRGALLFGPHHGLLWVDLSSCP